MKKILKTKLKVRFQDCDPFNHLNNSKYIDYFLNVREDQLAEHYDIHIFENLMSLGKSWVVTSNQISYIRPTNTMETIVIESQLSYFTNKELLVEMKMWDENETELKAILWTKFIYYDIKSKRISNHSDELIKLFKTIIVPFTQSSFEQRCGEIIKSLKTKSQ